MDRWSDFGRCPICKESASSMKALVSHLDKWHAGWLQDFFRSKGFDVPEKYPVRAFRTVVAALLLSDASDVLH
jgi:hypothetical protein